MLVLKITALEIRDFLTGEFEPVPLEDVMNYLRAAEKAGTIKLIGMVASDTSKCHADSVSSDCECWRNSNQAAGNWAMYMPF